MDRNKSRTFTSESKLLRDVKKILNESENIEDKDIELDSSINLDFDKHKYILLRDDGTAIYCPSLKMVLAELIYQYFDDNYVDAEFREKYPRFKCDISSWIARHSKYPGFTILENPYDLKELIQFYLNQGNFELRELIEVK